MRKEFEGLYGREIHGHGHGLVGESGLVLDLKIRDLFVRQLAKGDETFHHAGEAFGGEGMVCFGGHRHLESLLAFAHRHHERFGLTNDAGAFVVGHFDLVEVGKDHHGGVLGREFGLGGQPGLFLGEDIEAEVDEVLPGADDDRAAIVKAGVLCFALVVPLVHGRGPVGGGLMVVGVDDDFLEAGLAEVTAQDERVLVLSTRPEEGDVGQVGEGIKLHDVFNLGESVSLGLADELDEAAACDRLAKIGEVGVEIPVRFGRDGGGLEGTRHREGRSNQEGQEECFHQTGLWARGGGGNTLGSKFVESGDERGHKPPRPEPPGEERETDRGVVEPACFSLLTGCVDERNPLGTMVMRPILPTLLAIQASPALIIEIDYSYDTNQFFDTVEKREAMQAVADFFGGLIQDRLLAIDPAEFGFSWDARFTHPSTGEVVTLPDLVVPADTLIVYVGSRELGGNTRGLAGPNFWGATGNQAWFDHIRGRGQAGAAASTAGARTDFAPWGGQISFDSSTTWNFSLDRNEPGFEFVRIALHEMGHILGIGTADSFDNLTSDGNFNGAAATRSYGSAPPAGGGHLLLNTNADDSPLYGSFGAPHGQKQPVVMTPSGLDNGLDFEVFTDLDLAVLCDIGWELRVPLSWSHEGPNFTWFSSSFLDYRVERGSDLLSFPAGSSLIPGDGTIQSWADSPPLPPRAFYRLTSTPAFGGKSAKFVKKADLGMALTEETIRFESTLPRVVTGCDCTCPHRHE